MYFLYSLITAVGAILLTPYVLLSGVRRRKYLPNFSQRVGLKFPPELAANGGPSRAIWVHAVSVGEVLAAVPFARCLKQRFPGWRLVISTTTVTGQKLACERMNFSDAVFYFPFDWNGPVRRAFRAVRPGVIVILETEIWPNLVRHARKTGVPVIFVNGRLSERSFRGFSRAVKMSGGLLGGFLRRILNEVPLFGPSMDNFREVAEILLEAGAAIQVDSAAQLSAAWSGLLENASRRGQMGLAAREIVERNRGATAATLD